ncbi:MAG TPA: DegQ family serine endoprotease [Syntrophorhabdaceae bacterium]|nr:DegQ family serine endoprotease [Syntrophorhabdaceae bacterium]HOD76335.1 DegQ family serine endoprotease [Syntrophorhabdaceae bacterium]
MKNKRLVVTVCVLFAAALAFAYVRAQVLPEARPAAPQVQNVRAVAAFNGSGLPSLAGLVNEAKPSIVNISTTAVVRGPGGQGPMMGPNNPFKDFFGDDFFDKFFGNGPRREYKQRSLGSGFIIDKEGYILTNNHVVEKATTIKVKLSDEKEYDARIIGRDPKTDIALIKVDVRQSLPVAVLGDSEVLQVGDWVLAIGNPFGLEHTVTAGIVSAKGRIIGAGPYDQFIQTDASINPGNSGGPLLNLKGEVVGINTAIVSGGQGIGFAIPINVAKDMLSQLKSKGKVARGWLGVVIQRMTPEIAKSFGLKESEGALVADVMDQSPADKAGIRRGDVIISYNGKKIKDNETLPRLVAATEIGTKAKIILVRDNKQMEVSVTIGELQEEGLRASKKTEIEKDLGLVVQDITAEIAKHLNLKDRKGVIVTDVIPGSPAQEADIRSGDVIREIGRKPVRSVAEFKEAVKRSNVKEGIVMLIQRENATFYAVIRE